MHAFTVYEGRETDGCIGEDIRWRRQGRDRGMKNSALTIGCPGQSRPEGGGGTVIDVPCDLSLQHHPHGEDTKASPEEQAIKGIGQRARMI